MKLEHGKNTDAIPVSSNPEFDRKFGDVLSKAFPKAFREMHSIGSHTLEEEKEIFYYKLQVLQTLATKTEAVPLRAPESVATHFASEPVIDAEFLEFKELAEQMIALEPGVGSFITPEILDLCDKVIEDVSLVSFYFEVKAVKPNRLN